MWCAICRAASHVGPDLMPRLQHISARYRVPKSMEVPQKARNYGLCCCAAGLRPERLRPKHRPRWPMPDRGERHVRVPGARHPCRRDHGVIGVGPAQWVSSGAAMPSVPKRQVRKKVNDLLATGASYAMVVRALAADNAKLDKCDRVTIDSVRNHCSRHFPVQQTTHATYRDDPGAAGSGEPESTSSRAWPPRSPRWRSSRS